jgi:hypothetical protein
MIGGKTDRRVKRRWFTGGSGSAAEKVEFHHFLGWQSVWNVMENGFVRWREDWEEWGLGGSAVGW